MNALPLVAPRGRTIHRKRLFGGRYTPEEYHSKFAFPFGAKCAGCSRKDGLSARLITLAPLDELRKRDPMFDLLASDPRGWPQLHKMLVQIRGADNKPIPYVRLATAYSCKACLPAAERAAAQGPSWIQVEINRGPGPLKTVVGPSDFSVTDAENHRIVELAVEKYSQPRPVLQQASELQTAVIQSMALKPEQV